jgi:hypothetical protein
MLCRTAETPLSEGAATLMYATSRAFTYSTSLSDILSMAKRSSERFRADPLSGFVKGIFDSGSVYEPRG